jgi:hypothetical protein
MNMKTLRGWGMVALTALAGAETGLRAQTFTGFVGWESRNAGFPSAAGDVLDLGGLAVTELQTSPARNWVTLRAEAAPGLLRSAVDVGLGGLLLGEALSPAADGGAARNVSGRAFAGFTDLLTVTPTVPGLALAEGKVRFRIELDGAMGTQVAWHSGTATASWVLEGSGAFAVDPVRGERYLPVRDFPGLLDQDLFDGDAGSSAAVNEHGQVESGSWGNDNAGTSIVFDLPVFFGSQFEIGLGLRTEAAVRLLPRPAMDDTASGSAYAFADYGNTARLSVEGVFDGTGSPLGTGDFLFTSASGYGYGMAVVPEPGEWPLIIAALLPLTRWLRGGKRTVFVNGQQKG